MSDVIWATEGIEAPIKGRNRSRTHWKVVTACLFTSVCSVCCVVFMWISLTKIEQIKNEVLAISQKGRLKNLTSIIQAENLKGINRQTNESDILQRDTEKPQKELCKNGSNCKRRLQFSNDDIRKEIPYIPLDVPVQQSTISAVHFVPMGVTQTTIQKEFVDHVMCISKWNGLICRNNTFINEVSNQVLEFWQTAPWTRTHSGDVLSFEVNPSNPGYYKVKKEGLYLLYLNVLISATFSKHDVGIFISDSKKLICRENLDYVRHPSSQSASPKGKTCSVSGVFYIERNNTVSVKIVTRNTAIYLDSYNTNFGAVLLATMT